MLDKIRELERILDPSENDYLSALRERISPIKGKAHYCREFWNSLGYSKSRDGHGDGQSYGTNQYGDGYGYDFRDMPYDNGDGCGIGVYGNFIGDGYYVTRINGDGY